MIIMPSDVRKVFEDLNKQNCNFYKLNVLMMGWITMIRLYKLLNRNTRQRVRPSPPPDKKQSDL